ncbi:MAG TPA: UDP-N-acetylmuramate dehydrogenase [Gemmataceae bacterium]|jgi:UDP-N-acetylmuramate dehydrogenase|nr:UDP-N-acetylmuramate dehydrogenase [Gemmataceae bacterium]
MAVPDEFPEITRPNEPLAPYTHLKIGGPAEFFVQPRSPEELAAVLRYCAGRAIPTRVLGGGVNLLVRDETVPGVVLRLSAAAFTAIAVKDRQVRAGCGASLPALISATTRHGLTGFETLVGIPATVGGALRHNAGDRSGEIGQFVRRVEVLDTLGGVDVREQDELQFEEHASNLDDAVLLAAEFELETDAADAIVKRMRKAWIQRKAAQPFSFQAAARVFKNPKGFSAQSLLEQAGLAGQKVGGAEVSERNANYIVANTGTTARDVLRLIDLMRSRVRERTGAELEQEIVVW